MRPAPCRPPVTASSSTGPAAAPRLRSHRFDDLVASLQRQRRNPRPAQRLPRQRRGRRLDDPARFSECRQRHPVPLRRRVPQRHGPHQRRRQQQQRRHGCQRNRHRRPQCGLRDHTGFQHARCGDHRRRRRPSAPSIRRRAARRSRTSTALSTTRASGSASLPAAPEPTTYVVQRLEPPGNKIDIARRRHRRRRQFRPNRRHGRAAFELELNAVSLSSPAYLSDSIRARTSTASAAT